jgi:hypothetical protein
MIPTAVCLIVAYITKQLVQGADPAHVLTADIALIALVLFFRALKDLTSALFPRPGARKDIVRSRKHWSIAWSVLFGLGVLLGILGTRLWSIPESIAREIQTAPLHETGGSDTAMPIRPPGQSKVEHQ